MTVKPFLIVATALLLPFIAAGSSNAAQADPFFDCTQPHSNVQIVVCGNATLLDEDRILDGSYRRLLNLLQEPQKQFLIREQGDWVKRRDTQCAGDVPANPKGRSGIGVDDPVAVCVNAMYESRDDDLSARYEEAVCPNAATTLEASCKDFDDKALPQAARAVFKRMGCTGGAWANAVDLNDDGSPEYTVCCDVPPHGPCSFVILGKRGARWTSLSDRSSEWLIGFLGACNGLRILESKHEGYHDLCQAQGYPRWHVVNGKYHPVQNATPK
jgi:uncharacterized protein YecT (DUF1311 family)